MNFNAYKTLFSNNQALMKETNERIAVSKEIAINLYHKHFHNFMSYSEYKKAFPWMDGYRITSRGIGAADGSLIPQVFLSKDMWRIAHNVRKVAYRHARALAEQELKDTTTAQAEAQRLLKVQEKRVERTTAQKDRAAQKVVRMRKFG